MGIWAAKSAVLVAARLGLSDKAARCLLHMALESMDKADESRGMEARRFFGGRNSLATAVGFWGTDVDSQAARSAVKRAIRQLIDNDVVQLYREGYAGKRSEYYLRIASDGLASPELLPALEITPARSKGTARRTPDPDKFHGLRTRAQVQAAAERRQISGESTGPPSGTHGDRPAVQMGTAQRSLGDRSAVGLGPPSGPPNRSEQEKTDEQHTSRTRAHA